MKKRKNVRKVYLLPRTRLGKLAIGLIIAFFLLLITGMIVVSTGQEGGETIFDNLYISIPMISAGICAVACFFTGVISIIWKKERSVLVFISTLIGLIILWFIVGEIVVQH